MKIQIEIDGDIEAIMNDEARRMGLATTAAVRYGGEVLKGLWRAQVRSAGLGNRLANAIRHNPYPKRGFSYTPAGLVYTNADQIIDAFDRGVLITAKNRRWLAIPTKEAGKGISGKKMTPAEWQTRNGRDLRFVMSGRSRKAFLVADDLRISKHSGLARAKGGRRRKDGILSGAQTVPIFLLVPQVTLTKRLDLNAAAQTVQSQLPSLVIQRWRNTR